MQDPAQQQDIARQKAELQRQIVMADSELKKIIIEKEKMDMELRGLKKDEERIKMEIQQKQQDLKKIENDILQETNKVNDLKKNLNLLH
jgi:chromosome segregation ATPase